ncbi:MAG TPA: NUDIX hydrolase [Flavisolibacter sp.]|nr:NUDIX hydrolase [Flavisolibacter sp.]
MTDGGLLDEIKRLKAIADIGLLYQSNPYDQERYMELQDISFRLLNKVSGLSLEDLQQSFPIAKDYPTVKVDIRGLVLDGDKVLLVQESMDGRWSLPGGWADIGYTPKEVVIKECKEETGLDVIAKSLLAVFDKRSHGHPPQPFYVYKMVFYCEAISFELNKGFDILDVGYFDVDNLPELSENRILKSQIELLHKKVLASDFYTYFD